MSTEEKSRVLKMLEEGKITAAEALELLKSFEGKLQENAQARRRAKKIKIIVRKHGSEKPDVNIDIPVNMAKWALKFIPDGAEATINEHDIDLKELFSQIYDEAPGEIIAIDDDESTVIVRLE